LGPTLAFDEWGAGPTLGLVHGFTQTRHSWDPLLEALERGWRVLAFDAPGHGRSADVQLDLPATGAAIARTCGEAHLIGYSMGGRMALHAALAAPAHVRSLVLVGTTAGLVDPAARAARREADESLAARIEAGGDEGLPSFLSEWLKGPLFAGLDLAAAGLASRLENTAAGLASSLRLCGTGAQEPLDDRLDSVSAPTLLVVGEHDAKFRAEAERLAEGLLHAEIAVIQDAGHACHLEQPDAFVDLVLPWLDR